MESTLVVHHLASEDDWDRRSGTHYEPSGLAREGFVHCCTPAQLPGVVERYYTGRTDLVLLTVDPGGLDAPLVWEDTAGAGEDFPHVYGPIALTAVVDAAPHVPDS